VTFLPSKPRTPYGVLVQLDKLDDLHFLAWLRVGPLFGLVSPTRSIDFFPQYFTPACLSQYSLALFGSRSRSTELLTQIGRVRAVFSPTRTGKGMVIRFLNLTNLDHTMTSTPYIKITGILEAQQLTFSMSSNNEAFIMEIKTTLTWELSILQPRTEDSQRMVCITLNHNSLLGATMSA
jgi:hypothetical protein